MPLSKKLATLNIGGDAILDANVVSFDASGVIDFTSSWTDQLDIAGLGTLPAWFSA